MRTLVTIRAAMASDMPQVLEMIQELADFENEPHAVEITVEDLKRDGFGDQSAFHCFVAEEEPGQLLGMALVYPRYSTWKGVVLHLEDLLVRSAERGRGIGSQLLDAVVRYGQQQGVLRVSWEVLDWNTKAIEFYKSRGARVMEDWHVVQLDGEALKNYFN